MANSTQDKELLVVCHCNKHAPLFYRLTDGSIIPLGPEVTYVDPACPETSWDPIADASKQYVYGMNCPVAMGIRTMGQDVHAFGTNIMLEILEHSWRVLKHGGKVIFPGGYEIDKNRMAAFQSIINSDKDNRFKHGWEFSIESLDSLPINIGKSPMYPGGNHTAAVFTKPFAGGRHRRQQIRKAQRSRTRRIKGRYKDRTV